MQECKSDEHVSKKEGMRTNRNLLTTVDLACAASLRTSLPAVKSQSDNPKNQSYSNKSKWMMITGCAVFWVFFISFVVCMVLFTKAWGLNEK